MLGIPRSLYLYENKSVQTLAVHSSTTGRSLYLYENKAGAGLSVLARSLYLYENKSVQALSILARSLYLYEAVNDGEVFPWLMALVPSEQVRGGQVDLLGDGFGSIVDVAASSTITASSTNGTNVPGYAVDRTLANAWVSNDSTGAWIRFTFSSPQTIVAL